MTIGIHSPLFSGFIFWFFMYILYLQLPYFLKLQCVECKCPVGQRTFRFATFWSDEQICFIQEVLSLVL